MAILPQGIPDEYDCAIDGKGYLLSGEVQTPYAPLRSSETYRKVGRDLQVERQDTSEEMSENKVDDLNWSSQRSWYSGQGQRRLDAPQLSDGEAYLQGRNVNPFAKRGELVLSNQIRQTVENVSGGSQPIGYGVSSGGSSSKGRFWWVAPNSSIPSQNLVKSASSFTGTISSRTLTGFGSLHPTGMCTDGQYVYVSSILGIWRGLLSQPTVAMTQWKTQSTYNIAFVKERIMGWNYNGSGQIEIWEITDAAVQLTKQYSVGWNIGSLLNAYDPSSPTNQSVFAELKGFMCWGMQNGEDGYLWLWDGDNDPFQAAKFPGYMVEAVYSYAESVLYVLATRKANDDFPGVDKDKWYLLQVEVSDSGDVSWDILHNGVGTVYPSLVTRDNELFFPIRLEPEYFSGIPFKDSDNTLDIHGLAPAVASMNLVNNGLNLARFWGQHDGDGNMVDEMYGLSTEPQAHVYRNQFLLVGDDGEILAEEIGSPAEEGQLLSSAIDKNIDHDKVFLMGEVSTEPIPSDATVSLKYQITDPVVDDVVTYEVGTLNENGKTLRERLTPQGVIAPFIHYLIDFQITPNAFLGNTSPVVKKAGVGGVYGKKPSYDHFLAILALPTMSLRNGRSTWPPERSPKSIQEELEALRNSQEVVDYQEPNLGKGPFKPKKVQVRELDIRKVLIPSEGWGSIINVRLSEVPD